MRFRKERACGQSHKIGCGVLGGATPYIAGMALRQRASSSAGTCAGQPEQRSADGRLVLQVLTDSHGQVVADLFYLGQLGALRAPESSIGQ